MSKTKVGSSLGDDPHLSFLLSDFKDRISFNLSLFCILYSRLPVLSSLVCYSQNKKKKKKHEKLLVFLFLSCLGRCGLCW